MSEPKRHHYIPIFYLKQWTGADGRLCEYRRFQSTKVKRKFPKGTGYLDGLYTVPHLPKEEAQYVEKRFMQLVDSQAAEAMRFILASPRAFMEVGIQRKIAWSRFLYSLIIRTPQILEMMQLKINADAERPDVTLSAAELLPGLVTSKRVIPAIANMHWSAAYLDNTPYTMLTSDRPLIMSNGLAKADSHIAIPLSPRVLFLAVRDEGMFAEIKKMKPEELVRTVNNKVAEQAYNYVYGIDDTQLRFVANRLGKRVVSSPFG